ncbi:MAG: FAD binding domain-containing protein [Paracoccaceae bacterium]
MAYIAAKSLDEAFRVLAGAEVAVIAGGTDWFPQAGDCLTTKSLLDVNDLPGFRGISQTDTGWRIGAATRWCDISAADLPLCFDGLKAAAREVGSVQIQNTGTVAGNLCNASPAADGVPPLLTLNAQVELVSQNGRRILPLANFITGVRRTALMPGELVSAILIPDPGPDVQSGFLKLGSRKYLVISIAMVAVLIRSQAGRIADARVAAGACSPVAIRLPLLEQALIGHSLTAPLPPIDPVWLAGLSPIADLRGSADYRAEVVARMVERLLQQVIKSGERADV